MAFPLPLFKKDTVMDQKAAKNYAKQEKDRSTTVPSFERRKPTELPWTKDLTWYV